MVLLQPALALLCLLSRQCTASTPEFPTVDLGYARHEPTYVNQSTTTNTSFASYMNIRFAQPPLGDLRFKRPVTPPPEADGVQDGVVPLNSTNCLQSWPAGFIVPPGMNGTTWGSEDCLFLDVMVPEGVDPDSPVPVLHWVFGGGYITGSKDWGGYPAALFDGMAPDGKFIVVSSNYRLGQFGWMSSETEPSIDQNAGLYDVWAALEWTKKYAHLFGGDPDRVTAMGQSAGSGILQHLLAANSQGREVPFQQAILSSPGYRPRVDRAKEMTEVYEMFLEGTNCPDVACLRELPEEAMVEASAYMALDAPQGMFGAPSIGPQPVIDGDLVTDIPDRVLAENPGKSSCVSRVIAGGMANEGLGWPGTAWPEFIGNFARTPSESTIETIKNLYDRPGNESSSNLQTPAGDFYDDVIHSCHSYFTAAYWPETALDDASGDDGQTEVYRYEVSVPPAAHGDDLFYYFYDPLIVEFSGMDIPEDVALEFQDYMRRFILGEDMGDWPEYHSEGSGEPTRINLTAGGIETVVGEGGYNLAERCETLLGLFGKEEDGW